MEVRLEVVDLKRIKNPTFESNCRSFLVIKYDNIIRQIKENIYWEYKEFSIWYVRDIGQTFKNNLAYYRINKILCNKAVVPVLMLYISAKVALNHNQFCRKKI